MTMMPEPSPITNPSRERLNGRDAVWGLSFRVDMAVSRLKPVMPSTCSMVWVPPLTMTSASPRCRMEAASPMAWVLAARREAVVDRSADAELA